jgi:hypothetical protein
MKVDSIPLHRHTPFGFSGEAIKLPVMVDMSVLCIAFYHFRANDVLADSVSGYSNRAEDNGWYYGYAELSSAATYDVSRFKEMTWGIWGADN